MNSNSKSLLGSNGVTLFKSCKYLANSLSMLGQNILVVSVLGVIHNKQTMAEEMSE